MSALGPEDIDAFEARWGKAIDAADEFARRKEKGLPADRWSDGVAGAVLVADGIRAKNAMIGMFCDYIKELQRPSFEATGVFDRNGRETS